MADDLPEPTLQLMLLDATLAYAALPKHSSHQQRLRAAIEAAERRRWEVMKESMR